MSSGVPARPRLALPFTVIADGEAVHLIAGEDVRYSLRAGSYATLFAALLKRMDGIQPIQGLLAELQEDARRVAGQLLERLAGERILVAGPAAAALVADAYRAVPEGRGPLVMRLANANADGTPVAVLCQDVLDHHTAVEFNRRALRSGAPWLWVTTGPASRGYVSPVFLPNASCLACLLRQFQRLSPVPELYDALVRHGSAGGDFVPTEFPESGLAILEQLVRWKLEQLSQKWQPTAIFHLHVLELRTMEVSTHRVWPDPTCPECSPLSSCERDGVRGI